MKNKLLTSFKTKKMLVTVLFSLTGLVLGLAYWKYVGCASGGCAITSNPYTSGLYGLALGYFISQSFVG